MNKKILLVTLLTLLSTNIILAEIPMNKYLSKLKILETKDGRSVKTNTEGSYIDKMLHNKDPKFINENVRVEDLEAKGFPYIKVVAEDFAGLTRELKLFFRVSDKSI